MRMSDEGISRRTAENTKKELGIPKLSEDAPVVLEHKVGRMRGSTWETVEQSR